MARHEGSWGGGEWRPHRVSSVGEAPLQQAEQELEELLAVLLDGVVQLQACRERRGVCAAPRPRLQLCEEPPAAQEGLGCELR